MKKIIKATLTVTAIIEVPPDIGEIKFLEVERYASMLSHTKNRLHLSLSKEAQKAPLSQVKFEELTLPEVEPVQIKKDEKL